MSYDPMMYNPYLRFPTQAQQPVNGLVFIDKSMIDSYQMPPGSVSPPLFIDDTHFVIKTFDQSGGSAVEYFEARSIPMAELVDPHEVTVTKADLDAFEAKIMEAINERSFPSIPATQTATHLAVATAEPDPATGIIECDIQPNVPEQSPVPPVRR